jgi:homoserine kinase
MSPRSATVYAPATVANLGIGFDILGLALSAPGDTVTARRSETPGVRLESITGDGGLLPQDPALNTACVAAYHVLRQIAPDAGLTLTLHKGLPLASGLGSSSASAVAGAVAANAVFGSQLSRADLLPACVEAEAVVSGRHADNVGPALLGGIVLVTGITPDSLYPLPVPPGLHLAIITPDIEVPTAQARAVLPPVVPLDAMVHQTARVALLIHALHRGDVRLMCEAAASDRVVEPARSHLMPFLPEARSAALQAGALTLIISGAGPTLAAFCDSPQAAQATCAAVQAVYHRHSLPAMAQVTTVSCDGARLLETTG